jgi:DNA-directed RNA polymerase subunit RPC12/RpoP
VVEPTLGVKRTGLVCPACKQPVGEFEVLQPDYAVMRCPACGHRWSAIAPGVPKQRPATALLNHGALRSHQRRVVPLTQMLDAH